MIENADIVELTDRYFYILRQYANLALELAPKIDKLGKHKQELHVLLTEFARRGVKIDDPEAIKKYLEEEIEKINKAKNVPPPTT